MEIIGENLNLNSANFGNCLYAFYNDDVINLEYNFDNYPGLYINYDYGFSGVKVLNIRIIPIV